MKRKFPALILFLSLAYTSCTNSQGVQVVTSDIYQNADGSTEGLDSFIVKANRLFEDYTDESPQPISLFVLDTGVQLIRNPATELKDRPEGFLFTPQGKLSKADTARVLNAYKKRLGKAVFLTLDTLGNVLYYDSGRRLPRHNYKETVEIIPLDSLSSNIKRLKNNYRPGHSYITKIVSGKGANGNGTKMVELIEQVLDTNDANIVYLKDLSEAQILGYAMHDYTMNNNTSDSYLRGLLWLHFFYHYFDVNESTESIAVKPRWLLNFSVIDAAGVTLPDDSLIEPAKLSPLKTIFNKDEGYGTGSFSYSGIRRQYLVVPRKDDYYTEKWKYISLDLADEFSFESKTFSQMVLIVSYLKSEYGDDAIKALTSWYVANGKGPLLMTSFLKETYGVKVNINDLNQGYLDWVNKRNQ